MTEHRRIIVFTALALSREAQPRTGLSIKKTLTTLRPLRSAVLAIGDHTTTALPHIPPDVRELLTHLQGGH